MSNSLEKNVSIIKRSTLKLCARCRLILGHLLRLLPADIAIRIPTGINKGFHWIRGYGTAPEWMGVYERSKQKIVRELVVSGNSVFDIGANAGFYTLAFSRLVGSNGSVFAFEPLGRNCAKILRHLSVNRIENVILMQCAISEFTGIISFQPGKNDFVGKISACGSYLIPAFSLDDFVARQRIADPDLIKIDVEGAEAAVLKGAGKILQRRRPLILLALHGESQCAECFEILQDLHYTLRTFGGDVITKAKAMPAEVIAAVEERPETGVAACRGEPVNVNS